MQLLKSFVGWPQEKLWKKEEGKDKTTEAAHNIQDNQLSTILQEELREAEEETRMKIEEMKQIRTTLKLQGKSTINMDA